MMGFISWDIVSVILEVNLRRKKKNDYQQCDGFTKKCEVVHDFWAFFVQKPLEIYVKLDLFLLVHFEDVDFTSASPSDIIPED